MANYKLTNKAVDDLTNIWNYTFDKWSEVQANRYYNLIIESCHNIANNPKIGKHYDGITRELFGLKTNKHIIFYRTLSDSPIEITRILHEQMDLKNKLNE